jgi:hypothetical protein
MVGELELLVDPVARRLRGAGVGGPYPLDAHLGVADAPVVLARVVGDVTGREIDDPDA